jgi:hypothetical protein
MAEVLNTVFLVIGRIVILLVSESNKQEIGKSMPVQTLKELILCH